jgi:hypothetical protein
MRKCPEVKELISAYIDGEVTEIEKISIEQHLGDCSECSKEYEFTLKMLDALKEIPDEDLPRSFADDLHKRLEAVSREQAGGRVGFFSSPRFRVIAGIAACLLVMLVARDVLLHRKSTSWDKSGSNVSDGQIFLRMSGIEKAEERTDGIPGTSAALRAETRANALQEDETTIAMNAMVEGINECLTAEETNGNKQIQGVEGIRSFAPNSLAFTEPNHIKVSITIDSSNPEKHMSQLESFAAENGAVFLTIEDSSNRLDFKISRDRFSGIQEYLSKNYGEENVNYCSRVVEEPSFNIGELYDRYNELASRTIEERAETDTESLRIIAQKELLMDMIRILEEERESATVSVTFQETDD